MSYTEFNQGVLQERFLGQSAVSRAERNASESASNAWAWRRRAEELERRLMSANGQLNAMAAKATVLEVTKNVALGSLAQTQSALAQLAPNHPLASAEAALRRRQEDIDRKLQEKGLKLDRSNPADIKIIESR
ncbi:hypothetical protein ACW0US_18035 [Xanthomonas euvesicatoria]